MFYKEYKITLKMQEVNIVEENPKKKTGSQI